MPKEISNYLKYRGKCQEMSKALAKEKGYKVVKGWYYDPLWNREEPHWWCVDDEGIIHDPTKLQFPSGGIPDFYREFKGIFTCPECGKDFPEKQVVIMGNGNYTCCSDQCAMSLIGLA